jgi:hypothetical protein
MSNHLNEIFMKAKLLVLVVLFVLTVCVNAQSKSDKPLKFGVGAMIGLPMGDYTDVASLAYGADVMGEYAVAEKIGITLSVGYLDWSKKSAFKAFEDEMGEKISLGMIPVLAGIKYSFTDKIYGSAQAGLSFSTQSGNSGSAFTFAPGVGYKISDKFDLLLKYQSASKDGASMSFLGLRAGLTF